MLHQVTNKKLSVTTTEQTEKHKKESETSYELPNIKGD